MKAVVSMLAVFCGLLMAPLAVQADLVLTYDVNIVQTSVNVGDTVDWEVFATISGAPNAGSNFGVATASVSLQESFSETMTTGTVDPIWGGYTFTSGGTPNGSGLAAIGALMLNRNALAVGAGAGGGPFLIASGQYTATQAGIHTLQAVLTDPSTYFTAAVQTNAAASPFDQVNFGSDSVTVNGVPEPSSLILTGLAGVGAWRLRRRKAVESLSS